VGSDVRNLLVEE